jgi:glyceraldehyde 3-phosphate dehydrogenase
MSVKIAINGLGRIGRCIIRAVIESKSEDIRIVAVNGTASPEDYEVLLKYDSVHGRLSDNLSIEGDIINIGNQRIKLFSERDPALIPWDQTDAEIVFECTGKFKTKADTLKHLKGKVTKVIISAPSDDADATIVCGVNEDSLKPEHQVISIGSCTTNALAPILKLLHHNIGIESGYMTTIHAYTTDQKLLDNRHKDIRRARACALSMIPTSTGAAKAIGLVIPELAGKFAGSAIRVPVPNVSMIDLSFIAKAPTSKEQINAIIATAAQREMKDIVSVASHKLVSIDFNHNPNSSIFDPFETEVVNKTLVRIVSWYDNEWGFSNRMLDVAKIFSKVKESKCYQTLEQ